VGKRPNRRFAWIPEISQMIFSSPASTGDEGGDMISKATLVGKEETFRSLGIDSRDCLI